MADLHDGYSAQRCFVIGECVRTRQTAWAVIDTGCDAMARTVCLARLLVIAAMAATLVCACRQDSHRDGGPSTESAIDGGATPQPLAADVAVAVESLDGRHGAMRPQAGAVLVTASRRSQSRRFGDALQSSSDDSSSSGQDADATAAFNASSSTPVDVTRSADAPTTASHAPPRGAMERARAAGDVSARFVGIGLCLLAVLLLMAIAWIALRRRHRDDEPAGDRIIGWDLPRLPAGAALLDSPRTSGRFLDVTTELPNPDTPVAYPEEATLRHDPARAAEARARAVSTRAGDGVERVCASPYSVATVAVQPMQGAVPAPRAPTAEAPAASTDAMAERPDAGAPDGVANVAEPFGNGRSDLADGPPAHSVLVFAASQAVAAPAHGMEGRAAEAALPRTTAGDGASQVPDPSPLANDVEAPSAPLLFHDPEPAIRTGEAWARAGYYWWRLAWHGERGDASALEHAAEAFERARALEPERATVLSRMLSRCHRALASLSTGDVRTRHLDAAVSALDDHVDASTIDDDARLEWAGVLVERAEADAPADRASLLERAGRLIEGAAGAAERTGADTLRMQARIALARSGQARAGERAALEGSAVDALLRGVEQASGVARDECLAELIEVERARMARMNGAALVAHGQQVQSRLAPWLAVATSIEPLLAWLRLLGDWSGSLRGDAARRKLAEAEPLFRTIETLAPDARDGVRFARAYYLRLRARNEVGSARIATLREGLRELSAIDHEASGYPVPLEAAQMHLAVAEAIGGHDARTDYAQAVVLAREAIHDPANAGAALACALAAQLALTELAPFDATAREAMNAWSQRLLALAPANADALRLHARVLLLDHDPKAASLHCAAAWDAGADGLQLLPVWRRASDEWAQAANTEPDHAAWRSNRQHFRTASSSLP
ncbi:MAG TPA: hypothetical protein VGD42_14605 [Lysobacter sp.]